MFLTNITEVFGQFRRRLPCDIAAVGCCQWARVDWLGRRSLLDLLLRIVETIRRWVRVHFLVVVVLVQGGDGRSLRMIIAKDRGYLLGEMNQCIRMCSILFIVVVIVQQNTIGVSLVIQMILIVTGNHSVHLMSQRNEFSFVFTTDGTVFGSLILSQIRCGRGREILLAVVQQRWDHREWMLKIAIVIEISWDHARGRERRRWGLMIEDAVFIRQARRTKKKTRN